MNTTTTAKSTTSSQIVGIIAAAVIGLAVITVAGHAQTAALHDAAHDVRHATGFPCH